MGVKKRILVTGAGGFIAHHLIKRLKQEGCWVRGVDIKKQEYASTQADEFILMDLRDPQNCQKALSAKQTFDEIYHLRPSQEHESCCLLQEC